MCEISNSDIASFLSLKDDFPTRESKVRNALDFLKKKKNYVLQRSLGTGNFGIVVLATDRYNNECAIKIFINNHEGPIIDAESKAKIIKNVKSPYIVKYIEHFSSKEINSFFLVMEYCSQGNLQRFRQKNNLSKEQIIQYSLQLLYGLRELQKNSVIHCDLKPEGILISNEGELKISDFGISRLAFNQGYAHIEHLVNSLYIPPEGLTLAKEKDGKYQVSFAYDIYSAGGIIIFLCEPNFENKMSQIKFGKFPYVKGHPLESIFDLAFSMMNADPQCRGTVNEIISQLELMNEINNQKSSEKQKKLMKQLDIDLIQIQNNMKAKIDNCFP